MKMNVKHTAKLANLSLTDDELHMFEKQLSDVIEYVDQLQNVDTTDVIPTSQVTGLENVLREDKAEPSQTQAEALSNAKHQHNGLFQVKGILENE